MTEQLTFVSIAILGYLIAFVSTPVVAALAKRFGFVDHPNRNHPAVLHDKPTPRAGGVALYLSIVFTVVIATTFVSQNSILPFELQVDKRLLALLVGGLITVVVGTIDDKYDLSPYLRLLTNFLVALIVVGAGVGVSFITNPLGGQLRLDQIVLEFNFLGEVRNIILIADLVAIFWIVWLMNAVNWSSGVDGQLSGIVSVATFAIGLVTLRYLNNDPNQLALAILAFATAGSFLGFLPYHFYPQRIMPGYGGSALAGLLLATMSILAGGRVATAIIVLIVPLIDAFFTIVRRLLSGKSPFYGDREHFHHKLLDLGFSKSQIAYLYTFLTLISALFALSLDSKSKLFALISLAVVTLSAIISITFVVRKQEKLQIKKTRVN